MFASVYFGEFGLAIDYGLFTVTRFREELATGRTVEEATARTVATAGRTVLFSAAIIAASLGALFIFPNGVLRSVPWGGISAVMLAALLSVTALPAALSIVGRRIDWLGWSASHAARPNPRSMPDSSPGWHSAPCAGRGRRSS